MTGKCLVENSVKNAVGNSNFKFFMALTVNSNFPLFLTVFWFENNEIQFDFKEINCKFKPLSVNQHYQEWHSERVGWLKLWSGIEDKLSIS